MANRGGLKTGHTCPPVILIDTTSFVAYRVAVSDDRRLCLTRIWCAMSGFPAPVRSTHPLNLIGVLFLRWPGILMFCAGWLILGRDALTWFRHGGRLDLAITRVSDVLPAVLNFIAPLNGEHIAGGILDFSRLIPLSLLLLALGWCSRQLAQVWWEAARDSARAEWSREYGSAD
jgi:hypothetical protein